MLPYCVLLLIPASYAFFCSMGKWNIENKNKYIINVFFCLWLIMLMLRSETLGTDLPVYKYHFNNYPKMTWGEIIEGIMHLEFEAGYVVLSKCLAYFTDNFHWMIVLCAALSVIPIWKMYYNEARHGFLMVVLFVNVAPFVMYFSGLRQAIAMAFVVPCYYLCKEKKLGQCIMTVLVAYLFHKSAIVLLLLYPVYHLKLKNKSNIFILLICIGGVYVFNEQIFRLLMLFMQEKYVDRYGGSIGETGAYAVLLLLMVLLIYSYLIVDNRLLDSDTVGLRNILALCVLLQTFAGVHTIAMRMNYYFLLFVPILIPRIVDKHDEKYRALTELSLICMVCFFSVYFLYKLHTGDDILNIYPYESMFSDSNNAFIE